MKLKKLSLLIISLMALGCEEQFTWQLQESGAGLLVVEAVFTNENKNQRVRLTRPYFEQNQTPAPVSGAVVTITSSAGEVIPTIEYPAGSGLYYTDSVRAVFGRDYTLIIDYNGQQIRATASQPPGVPLSPKASAYREVSAGMYTLSYDDEFNEAANYTEFWLTWAYTDSCPAANECWARVIHYDLKNTDVNEQLKPEQEQVVFPAGTIILRRKYSVSDAYREYLRGMLSETAWRGGAFDVYPANAPTNLSEGALGFFAVSTVTIDTLIVQP